jgi:DNA-binding MarR family transcriptional regulator
VGLDELDASVIENFRRAAHLNRHAFARIAGLDKPGHPGQAIMLLALGSSADGMTQRQIAEVLRVSAPTVTVMLQKMEAEGLIERWTDEADQRLTRIRMTSAGRDMAGRITNRYVAFVEATVGSMSESDRREFARLLAVFADSVQLELRSDNES